jgi:hypothetical protein
VLIQFVRSSNGRNSSYAASPKVDQSGNCSVIVHPNTSGIENELVNAKVSVIDNGCADLSVLALAKILR